MAARTLTVGDTVLFLSLMAQLYGPLNFFGSYYRTIQQYMVRTELAWHPLSGRCVSAAPQDQAQWFGLLVCPTTPSGGSAARCLTGLTVLLAVAPP